MLRKTFTSLTYRTGIQCRRLFSTATTTRSSPPVSSFRGSAGAVVRGMSTTHVPEEEEMEQMHGLVITASGPDRKGVVHDVAALVDAKDGNIEESRMAMLGSNFALILHATFPPAETPASVQRGLEKKFPHWVIGVRGTQRKTRFQPATRILNVMCSGPDQAGIVRKLTKIFTDFDINVQNLETDTGSTPFGGWTMFNISASISVPTSTNIEQFEKALDEFEETYQYQIRVEDPIDQGSEDDDDDF